MCFYMTNIGKNTFDGNTNKTIKCYKILNERVDPETGGRLFYTPCVSRKCEIDKYLFANADANSIINVQNAMMYLEEHGLLNDYLCTHRIELTDAVVHAYTTYEAAKESALKTPPPYKGSWVITEWEIFGWYCINEAAKEIVSRQMKFIKVIEPIENKQPCASL